MPRSTFKKIIVNDENLKQINPANKKLVSRFLKEKATRSSDKTIEGYASDLNIFFVWQLLYNDNKLFMDTKKLEFSEFFSYAVDELKWGSARFSRMRSCLSSLSEFVIKFMDEEYPNFKNVILKSIESMPKNERREKTILSEEQVNNLLERLKKENRLQEALWLALAISSGARFSELLRFTTDIIDFNNTAFDGIFLLTTKAIKTKGRSREGKLLNKYIIKDIFEPYYNAWLPVREKIMKEHNQSHNSIFIKNDGSPAEDGTIRSWVSRLESYLGVPFYPHCLRHYIVTFLTRIGFTSELIVHLMGWTSESMYKIYCDLDAKDREWKELEKLKEALNKT